LMNESFRWAAVARKDIPGVVAAGEIPSGCREVDPRSFDDAEAVAGFLSSDLSRRPVILILRQRSAREILAWLATYSPASFPLTQSLRALSTDDVDTALLGAHESHGFVDTGFWPCVLFGELLGLSEQASSLDSIALSRANACFSFAQGRAESLHGSNSRSARECLNRLGTLEADAQFSKRPVTTRDLAPIWAWTREGEVRDALQLELARVVSHAAEGTATDQTLGATPLLEALSFDPHALSSGPIEDRVRSFQQFLSRAVGPSQEKRSASDAMLIAAAAICVGNGTSHFSLLSECGKRLPAVYPWFGLFGALAGQRSWEPAWNRAVNSLSRVLRNRFDLADPPAGDLSWVEYEFVRGVSKPSELLKHTPRFHSRLLSIEVVPGAVCQCRLQDEQIGFKTPPTKVPQVYEPPRDRASPDIGVIPPQVLESLGEIDRAITRTQSLIRRTFNSVNEPIQPELFGTKAKQKKRSPSRKTEKIDPSEDVK